MPYKTSKNTFKINCKTKEHTLTLDEYSRWLCLIEAIELITQKATQMKIDLKNDLDWVKPLAFQKYIVERHDSMKDEILMYDNNELNIKKEETPCITLQEPVLK